MVLVVVAGKFVFTASEVGDIPVELTTPAYFEFDECLVGIRGGIVVSFSRFLLLVLLPTELSPWTE